MPSVQPRRLEHESHSNLRFGGIADKTNQSSIIKIKRPTFSTAYKIKHRLILANSGHAIKYPSSD